MKRKLLYPALFCTFLVVVAASLPPQTGGNNDQYELVLPDEAYDYESLKDLVPNSPLFGILSGRMEGITNAGATLGRVLFYDRALSINHTISCGSCHQQAFGFADDKRFSEGFNGMTGSRNALHLADIGFTPYGGLLWDDRETDLAHMVLLPLENGDEMGITMGEIITRLEATEHYPSLFYQAFGTDQITAERIGDAMSQFVSSIAAINSRFDQERANAFSGFTSLEEDGMNIYAQHCGNCHSSSLTDQTGFPVAADPISAFFSFAAHNTGLDMDYADDGMGAVTGYAGDVGKFKSASLRNIALTAPYMHDGRFETLEEVIDFYSEEVQPHPNSTFVNDQFYQNTFPTPFTGFGFTQDEKNALLAFLLTLTDETLANNPMWSDPFVLVENPGTGIGQANAPGFSFAPNPFTHTATVDFGRFPQGEATIRLLQTDGRLVSSHATANRHFTLLREDLPAGTYLLEVSMDGNTTVKKIMAK